MTRRPLTGIALIVLGSAVVVVTGLLVLAGQVPSAAHPGATLAVVGIGFLALGGYFLAR